MFVKGHEAPSFSSGSTLHQLGAEPLRSRKGDKAVLQRAGTREAGRFTLSGAGRTNDKPSVQPPAERMQGRDRGIGLGKQGICGFDEIPVAATGNGRAFPLTGTITVPEGTHFERRRTDNGNSKRI
eukprot:gene9569-12797_t